MKPEPATAIALGCAAAALAVTGTLALSGENPPLANADDRGLALKGYDPVQYFVAGHAALGREELSARHEGLTWRFASEANRQLFLAEPARYSPRYGGWCAYGVAAKGQLFDVDPVEGWTIHEGRLYLNYDARTNREFRRDLETYVRKGDARWEALRSGARQAR